MFISFLTPAFTSGHCDATVWVRGSSSYLGLEHSKAHTLLAYTQMKPGLLGSGYTALYIVHEDDFEIVVINYLVPVLVVSGPDGMVITVVTQLSVSL